VVSELLVQLDHKVQLELMELMEPPELKVLPVLKVLLGLEVILVYLMRGLQFSLLLLGLILEVLL
jgi:hypothetical protein